ncbi:MAG: hypothetical protein ABI968_06350 [Acidobacteriota bacterium]
MVTIFTLRKACLSLILLLGASAMTAGHRGVSISISDGKDPARCEDIAIAIDGRPAERGQDRLRVPGAPGRTLRVRVPDHSGVRVVGSDRDDFEVLACKAASSVSDLARISVMENSDGLSVRGPGGQRWAAYLLIAAPRGASMDLEADNASIGLRGLSGRVTARSSNGPISLKDCSGDIDARAENGPIHLSGGSGSLHLETSNGPIGVALSGLAWSGAGLEARAVNGPVHLAIPAGYRSGAAVESRGNSPFRCRGSACAGARRISDDRRERLEWNDGPMLVHVSTENGPVSVRAGGDDADLEEGED